MKNRVTKNRALAQKGSNKNNRLSINQDPFFDTDEKGSKRRRKMEEDDEDIESGSEEEEDEDEGGEFGLGEKGEEGEEAEEETAGEYKVRVSKAYLKRVVEIAKKQQEDEEAEVTGDEEKERVEREGQRDSRVAKILQQQQLEESGRVRRAIASRYGLLPFFLCIKDL